jgi:riboflavin synthase
MFTGLIEDIGEIIQIGRKGESFRISIGTHLDLDPKEIGASIAVDGVCLTAVTIEKGQFVVEVSPETLGRTTLTGRKRGDQVNLERALRLSDRVGGHLVTGHVDGTGAIRNLARRLNALIVHIAAGEDTLRYLVAKGSVAVDGISLTVNEIQAEVFSLSIIPHTAQVTTIGHKKVGDQVNLEADILGKYVEKLLSRANPGSGEKAQPSALTYDFLRKHGFT